MPSESKEDNVLRLILENSPLKEWHFEEIVKQAKVTRSVANKWLKIYLKQGLIKKIKESGKFPYFIVGENNPVYYSIKRIYSLQNIQKSGLLSKLMSMKEAKTIILFGSYAKGDWYKDSDIDIFIYGEIPPLDKKDYEIRLKKSIEFHIFKNKEEIKQVKSGLMNNIVNGYLIKGMMQDVLEVI